MQHSDPVYCRLCVEIASTVCCGASVSACFDTGSLWCCCVYVIMSPVVLIFSVTRERYDLNTVNCSLSLTKPLSYGLRL